MIGRRLPIVDGSLTMPTEPGDYCGPIMGYTGDVPAVFLWPPGAPRFGHITSPPHTLRECPDGSLEVRASILFTQDNYGFDWHGYLDEGHVWRQV